MSYQDYSRLIYGLLLLQSLPCSALPQSVPELRMHVFEQTPGVSAPKKHPVTTTVDTDSKHFQMVVFEPTAPPQSSSAAPAGQTLSEYPRQAVSHKANDFSVLMMTDVGYQQEQMSWAVAAPGISEPLIETRWDNIDMMRLKGRLDLIAPPGIAIRTEASYAWTVSGSGEQSSFGLPANAYPADDGYSWNASAALGYRFHFEAPKQVGISVTPLAGYAFHRQRFTLQDTQTNTYDAEWDGPWVGLDATLDWLNDHELFASAQHHWANYQGYGDWQQLADAAHPDSFKHSADTTGLYGTLGYRYHWTQALWLSFSMDYQNWDADTGQEQFYLSSGTVIDSTLTQLSREMLGINLGVNWKF
jgi:hypothetical protein